MAKVTKAKAKGSGFGSPRITPRMVQIQTSPPMFNGPPLMHCPTLKFQPQRTWFHLKVPPVVQRGMERGRVMARGEGAVAKVMPNPLLTRDAKAK